MRIPAQELEHAVLEALGSHLDSQAGLLSEAPDHPEPFALLAEARDLKERISKSEPDALRSLLTKVVIEPDQLRLTVSGAALIPSSPAASAKTLLVPAKLQRSGLAMRLIVEASQSKAGKPDPKLIRLIARSHDWAMQLISGRAKTVSAIAKVEGVTSTYVTRLAHLGLLSPDLIQAILRGEQPATLTAHSLVCQGTLPLDWDAQRRVLGFK